jgi:hypothetical protein
MVVGKKYSAKLEYGFVQRVEEFKLGVVPYPYHCDTKPFVNESCGDEVRYWPISTLHPDGALLSVCDFSAAKGGVLTRVFSEKLSGYKYGIAQLDSHEAKSP